MNTLYLRIKELATKTHISLARVERDLHFSNGIISTWKSGTASSDKVLKLAEYFNVSTDYLLGRVDGPHDDLVIAAHMDDNLTEQQIEEINKFIEFQKQEYIKDRDKKNGLKKD